MKTLLIILLSTINCLAQSSTSLADFRLGAGIKLNGELQFNPALKTTKLRFRLSATVGFAQYLPLANNHVGLLPSVHLGVLVYNKGILGSNLLENYNSNLFLDFFANATLTAGVDHKVDTSYLAQRWVPLYHFSDFTVNPLQNTFMYSLSLGTNLILSPHTTKTRFKNQRIGFFSLNIARAVQFSYYNDGGPILQIPGDGFDRYYTGGLVLAIHNDNDYLFNSIILSYYKYTGWQENALDVADKLQLDHLPYKDSVEFGYNQQRWKVFLGSYRQQYSGYISLYDVDFLDIQDMLHYIRDFPVHPDYYYNWRFAIGGGNQYINY